jgi:hypothetical protein
MCVCVCCVGDVCGYACLISDCVRVSDCVCVGYAMFDGRVCRVG